MPSGLVFLYNGDGELIHRTWYKDRARRRVVINSWKIQYGVRFLKCYVQVAPNTREDLVSIHNGTNLRKDNKRGRTIKVFKYKQCYDRWKGKNSSKQSSILIGFKKQAI